MLYTWSMMHAQNTQKQHNLVCLYVAMFIESCQNIVNSSEQCHVCLC